VWVAAPGDYATLSKVYHLSDGTIGGPIRGLRLPYETWEALRREGITTLERLRAMADEIHTLPGIGPKTAQMIREEFARVTSSRKRR
jgi:DNA-directed RNA polymerase alpha subunit